MNRAMLLHLYPRAWRVRYADEFADLLGELPLTPSLVCDTLRGALDAHLHPSPNRRSRNAIGQSLLVLAIALALNHPHLASSFAVPRRMLGSAFMA